MIVALAHQGCDSVTRAEGRALRVRQQPQSARKEPLLACLLADIDDPDMRKFTGEQRLDAAARDRIEHLECPVQYHPSWSLQHDAGDRERLLLIVVQPLVPSLREVEQWLQPMLDLTERWDQRLNDDEKQSLAIARVILQRPRWVVLNGPFEVLDPVSRRRVAALFTDELAHVGIIDIGNETREQGLFARRLRLLTDPQGPTFSPSDRVVTLTLMS